MDRALSAAASGMDAQETRMAVIANNLANVSTSGFKRSRAEFQDVLYDNIRPAGTASLDGTQVPAGLQVGQGVRMSGTLRDYSVGDIKKTDQPLDVAIEGPGFFQVTQPNGTLQYTRDGSFKLDSQGRMVTSDGQLLYPPITVPRNASQVVVAPDGTVTARSNNAQSESHIGRITLATFTNPAGLEPLGHNLIGATLASGQPMIMQPGVDQVGALQQGFLEMSNVRAVDEMIDLINTQRAYEMGTKVIQAADQMLGSTAQLR
jgi:flagellar basal-body rod protein FlgG